MKVKTKYDYVLNSVLDKESAEMWIGMLESKTAGIMLEIHSQQPNYEEAKQLFETEKAKLDSLQADYDRDKKLLDFLLAYRNNEKPGTAYRVRRNTSNLEHPAKEKPARRPRTNWQEMGVLILKEAHRFMTVDDLFTTMVHRFKIKDDKETRAALLNALHKINERLKAGTGEIGLHAKKFGLKDWFDENMVPKSNFLKDFIQTKHN
jgi:hypothetical protein